MKPFHIFKVVWTLFAFLGLSNLSTGQIKMPVSVLGNGGNTATSSQYQIQSTVGQPLIGFATNSINQKLIGFWNNPKQLLSNVEWVANPTNIEVIRLGLVYPNPAVSSLAIPFSVPNTSQISIYVITPAGKIAGVAAEGIFFAGLYEAHFEVSGLAQGIYYCVLYADGMVKETAKIVIGR